ncbi:carboxypeptidase SOL1 isoform X2 [Cornus florida]|uniref:carboxypeptidase SOL1 isoform X2 n=1 Tax=Cornus florida TaxID=4283 RepID=UPI00289BA991|nr:carboxypeptidase SOL1 isoform X2 [Cornus florida]
MKLIFSLLFLSLKFSYFFNPTIARGGEQNSNHSGLGRHLFEENRFQKLDNLARGYMSNSDLEKAIKAFDRRCANVSRIYSIGKSIQGVPLWVMEISDKPGEEEAEPSFKFIGNVHGDEPVGRELLLRLANWLCDNYMKDPLATLIIDNVHLHILPSMNPDGFSLRRRGNANNNDLNRDFPDQGALVANYPWDGTQDKRTNYYACPDDEAFRFMASVYSSSHYNMSLSNEFQGGITNGASWYPVYGGMQDWNYIHGGCFELTLEISDNKWPTADELSTLWEFNRMSMLNLVASLVKTGIHGRIFSSDCGKPLPAFISVKGINYTIKASQAFADYHRLLAPGERYEVIATMPGYKSKRTSILLGEEAMTVDFVLDPEITPKGNILRSGYDCSCDHKSRFKLVEFSPWPYWEFSVILVLSLAFLCFLLKRRVIFNHIKYRQSVGPKRSGVV